jgi:hypothetical protein
MRMKLLCVVVLVMLPATTLADPLELVCVGEATVIETETTYGSAIASDGSTIVGNSTSSRSVSSPAQIWLRVSDDQTASIRLPNSLIPSIHSGGNDSWWPIRDLSITDLRISGTFRLNFLNKGRFVVDRRTGQIDLREMGGSFSGDCKKADLAPNQRLF